MVRNSYFPLDSNTLEKKYKIGRETHINLFLIQINPQAIPLLSPTNVMNTSLKIEAQGEWNSNAMLFWAVWGTAAEGFPQDFVFIHPNPSILMQYVVHHIIMRGVDLEGNFLKYCDLDQFIFLWTNDHALNYNANNPYYSRVFMQSFLLKCLKLNIYIVLPTSEL